MCRTALLPAIAILWLTGIAGAAPWAVRLESGAEADSNVERVETGDRGPLKRIRAPVGRAGARIDHRDHLLGGEYAVKLSGFARVVASSKAKSEDVMLYAGELRWLRPIGARPLAAGVHLTAVDSFGITDRVGARTLRNLGGDALLVLGRDGHYLTLGLGGRDFSYKPDHRFDWRGPAANARLDLVLWQTSQGTRSLELATTLGFEARRYDSRAVSNCAPEFLPGDLCTMTTALRRRDRYQRAGIELSWTSRVVATAGYQATVISSNSHGQSLVRQRIMASLTMVLPGELLGTATATLQIDQYPDGILLEADVENREFASLEDENRSSLQILLARKLSAAWSLEVRGAAWRDLANTGAAAFRRELIYAGVAYSR